MNRVYSKRRKRRNEPSIVKFISLILVAAIVLLYILEITFGLSNVNGNVDTKGKGYIAIRIEKDDTLWSIATEHMNRDYYDHDTYISELIRINDIQGDNIYAGEQIMIPVIRSSNGL